MGEDWLKRGVFLLENDGFWNLIFQTIKIEQKI